MTGVLINTGTVILGSLLGLLLKKGIPEKISKAAMTAIGLCTIYIGIDGALEGSNTIVLILSMVFGTIIGTAVDIDGKIEKLGSFIENKMKKNKEKGSVAQGFITGSLLFCIGAMTIVGSLNAGLKGDNELLITKAILDLISSCMLASTLGIGVLFAALFVLVYQGGLVLMASLLQSILTDTAMIAEITCAGSVMIIALGLNIIGITKIKVANFLPALILVPLFFYLVSFLPL
ncbi:MAG: DUF554 domain-containing protein [Ruminococcaceae bacterium]|nr:DUF554 domain-containing protein [Oscillospiraceae bacterium]MBR3595620.1 DUF554 domain-containing protein [Clostridia bacterium]